MKFNTVYYYYYNYYYNNYYYYYYYYYVRVPSLNCINYLTNLVPRSHSVRECRT